MAVISPTVQDVINPNDGYGDTGPVRGLELQIIDQLNVLAPGILVAFDDLEVNETNALLFLQQPAKDALAQAIDSYESITISSAYRTVAAQYVLDNDPDVGIAASPGNSNHESGLAIDVEFYEQWKPYLEDQGWDQLDEIGDFVHFDYLQGDVDPELSSRGVLAFQQLWNLNNPDDPIEEDGQYGPATEARLMISPAAGFQPADPGDGAGAPPYPGALLQLGDEGEDVRTVQEQLNELGEDLEADGVFGPLTEAAVRQFQEENGLDVDGIVGPDTWTALWEPPGDSGPAPGVDGLNAVLAEFDPTGASDATASQDGLSGGVEASRTMAETDAPEVLRFTDRFEVAGAEFDVPPALLAGIASRESRGGAALDENGEGDGGAGVGIMQVDQTVRPPEEVVDPGDDFASQGHINQATEILRGFIDQAADAYPGQSAAVQLQAGVAAYNTGASAFEGGPDEIDVTTTGEDYSNDVIARAQYYAENWNVLIA